MDIYFGQSDNKYIWRNVKLQNDSTELLVLRMKAEVHVKVKIISLPTQILSRRFTLTVLNVCVSGFRSCKFCIHCAVQLKHSPRTKSISA
ncbi:hypothetical protein XENTR_v10014982 [Xenopus tropicalis]|nr:hypothetical protein XENTR_v10014982 [Xenopus tropicalis]